MAGSLRQSSRISGGSLVSERVLEIVVKVGGWMMPHKKTRDPVVDDGVAGLMDLFMISLYVGPSVYGDIQGFNFASVSEIFHEYYIMSILFPPHAQMDRAGKIRITTGLPNCRHSPSDGIDFSRQASSRHILSAIISTASHICEPFSIDIQDRLILCFFH
jgi:hypothetical protein